MATFGIGLGRPAITEADEAYYAEASREMMVSGDWVTPHFNFEDRWQKPVLYYWLTAATYTLTGPTEGAARLWSALSGVGLVLLAWMMARRDASTRPYAWLAGAVTATCFGYFPMARSALPDLPLAFCVTLTLTAVWAGVDRRGGRTDLWWALAGLGTGLGCLMKGPVAIVVPILAFAPAWWLERRDASIRWRHLALAAGVAAAVALPWYLLMTARHGVPYLQSFFVGDNLERFTTTRFNDARPLWFYLPVIAGGLLPWAAYAVMAAPPALVDLVRRRWHPSRHEVRLLSWAVMPTVFFMASVGQQPRYVLPVLPPLAILMAAAIGRRIERARNGDGSWGLTLATWLTAAIFALCAVLLVRLQPLLVETNALVLWLSVAGAVAGALAFAAVAVTRTWHWLPVAGTVAAAVLWLGLQFSVFAPGRPEAVERMASLVRTHRSGSERIGPYRAFTRNLVFYTGLKQEDLYDAERASQFLASPDRVLLIVRAQDLPALAAAAHVEPRTLARVEYFNTATLRLRTLVSPDPASELETVLLVTNR